VVQASEVKIRFLVEGRHERDASDMNQTSATIGWLLVIATVTACNRSGPEGPAETEALVIGAESVLLVERDAIHTGPVLSGTLEAERSATVRAEVGGSVLETTREEGQPVAAGEILARIQDNAVQDAYLSAQSGVRSAENALEVARREAERAERLVAGGALAARDLDLARSSLAAAQAQAADAIARQAQALELLEATRVRAPLAGVVSERSVNPGDVVTPGTALFTVIDPRRMRLEASVPSEQLAALEVGTPVEFEVRGYPGTTFRGVIERINPAADPVTRQVPIYVSVPNTGGRLVAGLYADGQVQRESRETLVVPLAAVDETGSAPTVLRVRGGSTERIPVTLGVRDASTERVEIVSGVAQGDTLLAGAARGITPGTPVQIGARRPLADAQ
jgi:RND family efflux transporter MFP subunit